jgi:hypothetical protein
LATGKEKKFVRLARNTKHAAFFITGLLKNPSSQPKEDD